MGKINLNEVTRGAANTDTIQTNGQMILGGHLTLANGVTGALGAGTFTATGTTGTTVTTTAIEATDVVVMSMNTAGGTPGAPYLSAITAGTSFVVKSATGDTSVYNWALLKRA